MQWLYLEVQQSGSYQPTFELSHVAPFWGYHCTGWWPMLFLCICLTKNKWLWHLQCCLMWNTFDLKKDSCCYWGQVVFTFAFLNLSTKKLLDLVAVIIPLPAYWRWQKSWRQLLRATYFVLASSGLRSASIFLTADCWNNFFENSN